jgi:predicted Zn-ribbon and HTH transcriptional regulator
MDTWWRRWTQAAEALDAADEAEEIQAVGMRCRECLLAMVRAIATAAMVPAGTPEPNGGDFKHWAEIVADAVAPGGSAKAIRRHLKSLADSTWELVGWLTHAANATKQDGEMVLEATQGTLAAFCRAVLRHERGAPERCPSCSSYRIASVYVPATTGYAYRSLCASCGWTDASRRTPRRARSRPAVTKARHTGT